MAEGRRLPERLEPVALLPRAQAAVFVRKFAIAPNAKKWENKLIQPQGSAKGEHGLSRKVGALAVYKQKMSATSISTYLI